MWLQVEAGLATKREGLEQMRRERVPHIRMFDVAEYYYKVRSARMLYLWVCRV